MHHALTEVRTRLSQSTNAAAFSTRYRTCHNISLALHLTFRRHLPAIDYRICCKHQTA